VTWSGDGRRRVGASIAGAVAVAGLTAAHTRAASRPELTGLVVVLDHLFDLALTGALLALCGAVGLKILGRLGIPRDSSVEDLAYSTALGAGILGTILLLLGALGGFDTRLVGLALAGCCALVWRELVDFPRVTREAGREVVDKAGGPALLVAGAVGICLVALGSMPPTDYDSLMYHLQIPATFLDRGSVHVPDGNLHVSFLGPLHMLYVPLLAWGAESAPALLNVAFALLLAAALLTAGTRLFSPAAGRLAFVLLWGSPMLLLVGITARVDSVLACFLFLGHYALLRAWNASADTWRWLVLSGALLGLAVGVKHLGLVYALALGPLVLITALRGTGITRPALLTGVWGGVALLAALPWLVKNWILLGAPFYPQLAANILPPWLASLYGSSEIPSALATLSPLRDVREPFSMAAWFFAPERLSPEAEGTAYGANRAFLALLLSFMLIRKPAFLGTLLPSLLFIASVVMYNASLNVRYLTPVLPILTLAAAAIIARLADRTSRPSLRSSLYVLVIGASLAPTLSVTADRLASTGTLAHAMGAKSKLEYLSNPRNPETADYMGMALRVNDLTGPDDRILMLFEARGFRLASYTLPDNNLVNWALLQPIVADGTCLPSSSITHVLLATRPLGYYRSRGLDPATLGWDGFPTFAARCLTPVEAAPGWVLFRVRST
jgi:4-amino-4-deoxy-L-arabinose transferase-like glycosyltransferase